MFYSLKQLRLLMFSFLFSFKDLKISVGERSWKYTQGY